MTYTQIEAALDNVRNDIIAARKRFADGKLSIQQADNALGGIPTTYAQVISAINAGSGAAYDVLKARQAEMVAEFQALKGETAAAVAALG